jgi:S1-C subfamily serine protease
MEALLALSNGLAGAVERAGRSVVRVNGRPRLASTGVHWRAGVIVTADHTVRADNEITITLADGRVLPATLAGRDPGTDLAVLRVEAAGVPAADIGDPAALRVAHLVLALGAGPTASWGVVSALGGPWRTWRGGEIDQLIRLDLTLYPGFSGGPLVDSQGRVVGINTSGLARHTRLAVPGSTVSRVVDELVARGRVRRGYLGLGMQTVPLPGNSGQEAGLLVVTVDPGGPGARAGLIIGDVLLRLGAESVRDVGEVQAAIGPRAGTELTASVLRGGVPVEVRITVGDRHQERGR